LGSGSIILILLSFTPKVNQNLLDLPDPTIEDIVKSYKKAISEWPKPDIDYGVQWKEFSPLKQIQHF
jgi:cytochrome c peroxidase